jgi:hypothetical protein
VPQREENRLSSPAWTGLLLLGVSATYGKVRDRFNEQIRKMLDGVVTQDDWYVLVEVAARGKAGKEGLIVWVRLKGDRACVVGIDD